jgi:hypothetical protein
VPAADSYDGPRFYAGSIPLVLDEAGMFTVPQEYQRMTLPVTEDFMHYAAHWKTRNSLVDYLAHLVSTRLRHR